MTSVVLRLLRIWMNGNRQLKLFASNHRTLQESDATELATVSLPNPSQAVTSSNNLLAYRPRFTGDLHSSNLAGVFINMEGVFPCLQPLSSYYPICQVFSEEEDGFRSGKALIGAGDIGNHFRVFSTTSDILTYGIAIQDCPEFNTTCFPTFHSFIVSCNLPRVACSWFMQNIWFPYPVRWTNFLTHNNYSNYVILFM